MVVWIYTIDKFTMTFCLRFYEKSYKDKSFDDKKYSKILLNISMYYDRI